MIRTSELCPFHFRSKDTSHILLINSSFHQMSFLSTFIRKVNTSLSFFSLAVILILYLSIGIGYTYLTYTDTCSHVG